MSIPSADVEVPGRVREFDRTDNQAGVTRYGARDVEVTDVTAAGMDAHVSK